MRIGNCPKCGSYNVICDSNDGSVYCCECEQTHVIGEDPVAPTTEIKTTSTVKIYMKNGAVIPITCTGFTVTTNPFGEIKGCNMEGITDNHPLYLNSSEIVAIVEELPATNSDLPDVLSKFVEAGIMDRNDFDT